MSVPDGFQLGDVRVWPTLQRVERNGTVERVEPRLIRLLECLAETPGHVVSRDTLLSTVWPEGYASDEGLTKAISALRQALGDTARDARMIETISKRGYRLVPPVEPFASEPMRKPKTRATGSTKTPRSISLTWARGAVVLATVALLIFAAGRWAYYVGGEEVRANEAQTTLSLEAHPRNAMTDTLETAQKAPQPSLSDPR